MMLLPGAGQGWSLGGENVQQEGFDDATCF